jgi:hypothetical protein
MALHPASGSAEGLFTHSFASFSTLMVQQRLVVATTSPKESLRFSGNEGSLRRGAEPKVPAVPSVPPFSAGTLEPCVSSPEPASFLFGSTNQSEIPDQAQVAPVPAFDHLRPPQAAELAGVSKRARRKTTHTSARSLIARCELAFRNQDATKDFRRLKSGPRHGGALQGAA